ncbi:putative dual-specificity RNA methyltransferase RlmN [Gemmata obscuriglobus]|uniref:Probable dual-specificity RNA methyltransferase RlmN n=1 Tax=Gemmata obscuriglobus TaxID=114 RepID=A0A2Z3H9F5_9BACT|nr:23S rRNA (adenine(2503)-C(2))-methyltransferase RlmN [Gemmata obscuriglobus]AWM37710.1 23S rRNA (adenine(2503)-C(2))-methyltransferase RlmN [Gemmata obscuriglobus]QEG29478.1 putative dual-specificity RNA methyltransferase RlmN [Gemmata obscuriglobus]VTS08629.1 50s rrna methyltransferase : Probable dual-specificity RNA methyltransferase RlmN OS=Singulisphaera acidiphila (strain ATCC BAA-1392 / DSM 18658 / VKM B-2454 / MOB10) GN=rlmN PE=3 SV=1: Radical_SAM [Gemmata obscuriglobus UQM 2246]
MLSTLPILETGSLPAGTEGVPPSHAKPGILDVPAETLRAWLTERGQPPMRVNQICKQILANRATAFEDMSDLPKGLRADLAGAFRVFSMSVERHFAASDDTHKFVLRLADGRMIEAVLIQDDGRATACISTQVGCGMGCVFCASGLNGVVRNLTAGEMVEQLVLLRNLTDANSTNPERAPRLTHIVVMGMGEPLANLDNLLDALAVAGDKNGLGIGARHVTISTVGLPAKIRKLAESGKQYHLAVSLHAPNDELRTRIVPTNDKVGMDAILAAADEFYEKTGRQVTYEYVVLGGLNDQAPHARQLAGLLRGRQAHVNLIPWNAVEGLAFKRPADADLQYLIDTLRRGGISVKVRKRKGAEIDAACGQLRRQAEAALGAERVGERPQ